MSPLYKRRRELAALEERERQGESFWSENFSIETRNRLQLVMQSGAGGGDYRTIEASIRVLLADLGLLSLYKNAHGDSRDQFFRYLAECDDDMVPSVVEAFGKGYERAFEEEAQRQSFFSGQPPQDGRIPIDALLVREINRVLAEDRIAFEYVGGEMVPFASRELHVEVVEPVLRLLATPGWERVEKSYQSALSELARDEGADAITDAGTALQEALSFLGAEGNQLGDLTTSAKSKGIIASHDAPLLQTIDKACRWASADRSNKGDARNADEASREDAWFTVHVVGAILLRLTHTTPRGATPGLPS
ncbi:hypothetical protein RU09_02535 [Microbacterium sp. MEJ108Y]|uniref:hypothetical protein n=1 Tax=Microbacterium sp. MEJ108Y TaxID=1587523 RepID=UPI0005AC7FDE|nr:hypothetical protein [Microbacterium sp. MEJ108Y]KIP95007.1 hypothetical protein RU09_02535 [Microbacterium sp. MEJ108Y]